MNTFQFLTISTIMDAFPGIRSKEGIECAPLSSKVTFAHWGVARI